MVISLVASMPGLLSGTQCSIPLFAFSSIVHQDLEDEYKCIEDFLTSTQATELFK